MKNVIPILICLFSSFYTAVAQTPGKPDKAYEKIIKAYFAGWANKDWDQVSAQLAEGFTFTSAAPDDHISIAKFKEKCWVQAQHIQKFEFANITGNEREAFAIVHVITKENKVIRNVEYFNFINGKIKSIEVFFGGNGQGFPTNEKQP